MTERYLTEFASIEMNLAQFRKTKTRVKHKYSKPLLLLALALGFYLPFGAAAEEYLYRYENEEGVMVLNHTIPPEYAQQGYEILSVTGQVVEVVEPAPTDGDIAKENALRILEEKFEVLKRRYSSIEEIEKAKTRRLKHLDTNIAILRGNISSIQTRIDNLMSDAADVERSGRDVPEMLLRQIKDAKTELSVAESQLEQRLDEYQETSDRYDSDMATFIEAREMLLEQEKLSNSWE